MTRRGYDRQMVVSSLAGGGTLGLLIPPSLSLLIYGALTETSIGKLFLAGVIPGLLFAIAFMVFIFVRCVLRPEFAPKDRTPVSKITALVKVLSLWPFILLITAIMGSIAFGVATPTEAAGIGVLATILVGFFWGDLTPKILARSIFSSTLLFASILFVVLGATVLAQAVSLLGIPQTILKEVSSANLGPLSVLSLIVVIYLILGCFFDGLSLMIMTLPIVVPLMIGLDYDPIWLGVVITILIEIGQITPGWAQPFSARIRHQRRRFFGESALAAIPYWLILLTGILILTSFPQLALYLPTTML